MAGVMLYAEELRRTQSLAALNSRKNEELKVLLDARTKELRATEGISFIRQVGSELNYMLQGKLREWQRSVGQG